MTNILIVDGEHGKCQDHEPRFPGVTFKYAENGDAATADVPSAEVIAPLAAS